ncbi:MAG: hypothetical protein IJV24_07245 [Prevotella sp.]|nr:hypothetical protein [Prevotella sp.]
MITLPPLPRSWSELSWQQLCLCWDAKMHYGGNADVARVAALLGLLGVSPCSAAVQTNTGETLYRLRDKDGCRWTVTAREAAHMARKALPWFDYPYGDPGEEAQKDEKGKVVREGRDPVRGYVNPAVADWRDALMLPIETLQIGRRWMALPQVALNNLTWQQYRSLQALVPQLFQEDIDAAQAVSLQAQFLSHCLAERSPALFDTTGGSIRLRPHWEYQYNAQRAERLALWLERRLTKELQAAPAPPDGRHTPLAVLYHICLQCYQTAMHYYESVYPLLFGGSGKTDPLHTALSGETDTLNAVMKYAGYTNQQEVYDTNLPFVFGWLNTMAKEAKEVEKMNSKIKRK